MKKLVTSLFRKSSDSNLSKSVKLRMETLESRQLLDAAGLAFANDADVVAVDTVVVAAPIDEAVDVSSVADSEAPAVELSTDSPVLGARITTIKAANTNFSYQWYAGYSADSMQPLSGATYSYYSPSYAQIGMYIGVEATNADGETTTLTTANTVVWNLASVSISGDALIGTELTASVKPTIDAVAKRMAPDAPIAPEVSYQWYRVTDDGDVAIEGATNAKYTAAFDDVGFALKVVATGVGAFGGEVSAVTDVIEAQGLHLSTTSPKLGQRIISRLNPADSYTKYQWYYGTNADDMTAIPGAVYSYFSATYKYVGYKLQLVATYQRGELAGTSVESVITNPVYRTAVGPAVSFESDGVLATTGVDDEAAVVVTTDAPIVGARVKASVSTGDKATWQWYADGAAISKATASYYTPSAAMAGKVLSVTATLADGQEISAEVGTITRNLSKVTFNNFVPVAGLTMTAYTSPVTQTVSAQWYRVTDEGDVAIDGANSLKYTLTSDDIGYKIKLVVTGEDSFSGTVEQTTAVPVLATSPLTLSSEEAELGLRITTTLTPADQYATYQWYRKVDEGWEWINGATFSYYTASYNGIGDVLRVVATYKTGEYAGLRASAVTSVVTRRVTSVELNSATPEIGVPLKTTVKAYGADVDYQWYRVSQTTGKAYAIEGATGSTYTPTVDDSQYSIRVVATGKGNYSGSVEATTENIVDHTPVILENDSPILGQRQRVSVTLSELYPTYQWYYGTSEADMTAINGATYSYFTPSYKHVGYCLQVKATYTSGPLAGLSYMSEVSNPITRRSDVVEGDGVLATTSAVLDSEAPAVELSTDSPVLGGRITTIKAANTNFSYQWYAGYSADAMQPLSGATYSYYSPSYAQIGMYIGVEATNADGETTTLTTANTVVWNLASVSISGDALIGTELTASVKPTVDAVAKRMAPDAPIAPEVAYQWYRVTDDGDVAIDGATNAKYTAAFDDVGFALKVVATGVGAFGGEVSAVTDIIEAQGLHLSTTSPKLGQRITSRLNPADSYTKYQWYYGTNADDMTAIPGAVYSYFSATYKYVGYKLQLVATYQRGEMAGTTVESVITNPVYRYAVGPGVSTEGEGVLATTSAVIDSEAPAVELSTDSPVLGGRITTIKAANTNFTYQWYAGYSADAMQPISGATFSYYSPSYPQIGMYIGVEATNADGETTTLTTANTVVWNLANVSISGEALIGTELTASVKPTAEAVLKRMAPGAPVAPEVSYQWYRVTDDGDVAIDGATNAKYTAAFDDVGFALKVVATGVGAFGGEVSAVTDIIEAQGLHLSTTSPKLGQRITSRLNPADSYTKYQWYYGTNADDMTAIPGAVYSYFSATYKYVGYKLQLVATYQRGEMAGTTVESVITNPVYRSAVGSGVSTDDSGLFVGDDSQEEGDDLSESILETIALGLI